MQNKQHKGKGKDKAGAGAGAGFQLSEEALARQDARHDAGPAFALPDDALPSHPLDELSYADVMASKAPSRGLQPDLDPSVREVLEALDDEAYAADDGAGTDEEDEFWDGVLRGGEVADVREQHWEEEEEGDVEGAAEGVGRLALEGGEQDEGSWAAVKAFKAAGGRPAAARSDVGSDELNGDDDDEEEDDFASEGGDTIGALRASLARRPARKAQTAASGFSMSSSAMVRNKGLQTLDEQFDQVRLR